MLRKTHVGGRRGFQPSHKADGIPSALAADGHFPIFARDPKFSRSLSRPLPNFKPPLAFHPSLSAPGEQLSAKSQRQLFQMQLPCPITLIDSFETEGA